MGNKDIIRIYVKVCLYSSNKHMLSMHTIQILNYQNLFTLSIHLGILELIKLYINLRFSYAI